MAKNIKVVPSLGIIQLSGSNANTSISVTDDGQLQFGESSNTGSLNVTGDLVVQGSVTAQEFKTEFVSASIVYRSGSTKFGDTSDDVHQFTGSIALTGSQEIIGENPVLLNLKSAVPNRGFLQIEHTTHVPRLYLKSVGHIGQVVMDNAGGFIAGGGFILDTPSVRPRFHFTVAQQPQMSIVSGDVGIGTTAPERQLHISSSANNYIRLETSNTNGYAGIEFKNDTRTYTVGINNSDHFVIAPAAQFAGGYPFTIESAAYNESFKIKTGGNIATNIQTGNFGIGTESPSVKLEVSGSVKIDKGHLLIDGETHSRIYLQNPGGSGDSFIAWYDSNASYDWYFGQTSENGGINLYNYTAGGTHTTFNTNGETYFNLGNVGIGTSNPATKIDVDGTGRITDTVYLSTNANSKTGIGTSSPNYKLDVFGSGNFTDGLTVTGSALIQGVGNYADTNLQIVNASGDNVLKATNGHSITVGISNNNSIVVGNGAHVISSSTTKGLNFYSNTQNGFNFELLGLGSVVRIDNNTGTRGFMGLGTTAPQHRLDVSGSGNFTDGLTVTGSILHDGNLTVSGIVTAKEFHTEFVSASIVYQSGSTKFGDTADDTHSFTGSLEVTGSVSVADNITLSTGGYIYGDTTNPFVQLTNVGGAVLGYGTSTLRNGGSLQFESAGQVKFRVGSNGLTGINTATFNNGVGLAVNQQYSSFEYNSNHLTLRPGTGLYYSSDLKFVSQAYSNRGSTSGDALRMTLTADGAVSASRFHTSINDTSGNIRASYDSLFTNNENETSFRSRMQAFSTNPIRNNYHFQATSGSTDTNVFYVKDTGKTFIKEDLTVGNGVTVTGNIVQTSTSNFIGTRKVLGISAGGLDLMDDSGTNGISIKDGGNVQFTDYGSGNNTGTTAYRLAVDSSGNIIEESLGAGAIDGLGSGGFITRWEDTDTITSSSIYENNGNIGIGTVNPSRKLHVYLDNNDEVARFQSAQSNDVYVEFVNNNSDGASILGTVYNDFVFSPSGSETVRFTSDGKVGIGFTNPGSALDVNGTIRTNSTFQFYNTGGSVYAVGTYDASYYKFLTSGIERMRITATGNVGIGTTSPAVPLHVSGTFRHDGSQYNIQLIGGSEIRGSNAVILRGLSSYAAILAAGSILHTAGTDHIFRDTNSNALVTIKQAGNVGIGVNNPSDFNSAADNLVVGTGTGTNGISIYSGTDSAGGVYFADESGSGAGNRDGVINYNHSTATMDLKTGGNQRVLSLNTGTSTFHLGDVVMENDLTVKGIVTAKEFHTEFVSASIVYSSGSTKFGDTPDDIHQFTGSLEVSGSINSANIRLDIPNLNLKIGNTATLSSVTGAGQYNTAIGQDTGQNLTTGYNFTGLGYSAGKGYTTGNSNVSLGNYTGPYFGTSNGVQNVLVGSTIGAFMTDGASENVGVGGGSLYYNTSGAGNTALGRGALQNNATGSYNTAVGYRSAVDIKGDNNIGIGANSMRGVTLGSNNIVVGDLRSGVLGTTLNGVTAIGSGSRIDFYANSTGVGIGTTSPSAKLQVQGSLRVADTNYVQVEVDQTDSAKITMGVTSASTVGFIGVANNGGGHLAAAPQLKFLLNSTEVARFDENGNLGIGTTSPSNKLHVAQDLGSGGTLVHFNNTNATYSQNMYLSFNSSKDVTWSQGSSSGGTVFNTGTRGHSFQVNGTTNVVFNGSGNVGIGVTNVNARLHLSGSTGSSILRMDSPGANTLAFNHYTGYSTLRDLTLSNNRLLFLDSGAITTPYSIGIGLSGATAPSSDLHIGSNNPVIQIGTLNTSTGNAKLQFYSKNDGTGNGYAIQYTKGTGVDRLDFIDGGGTAKVSFVNGGNVGIGTTSPAELLDVDGTARAASMIAEGIAYAGSGFQHWGDGGTGMNFPANDRIDLDVASTTKIRITDDIDLPVLINPASSGWYLGSYNNTSTYADISTIINGSTFGGLITGPNSGHLVVRLQNNDTNDSFAIVANSENSASALPDKVLFRAKSNGQVEIPGDLTVEGIVTAQEFHTEFVSASIIYQSGSTKFGDTTDDVHQFTGSVDISAAPNNGIRIAANNSFIGGGASGGDVQLLYWNGSIAYYGRNTLGGSVSQHEFRTGGATRLTVSSNGYVGIGTTTPARALDVRSSQLVKAILSGSSDTYLDIETSSGSGAYVGVRLSRGTSVRGFVGYSGIHEGTYIGNGATNPQLFVNRSDGNVGIGTTNPAQKLQVDGNIYSNGGNVYINGDKSFVAVGNMKFETYYNSAYGERMRLTEDGNVGIGTTAPTHKLEVAGTVSGSAFYGDGQNLTNVQRIPKVEYQALTASIATNDVIGLPNGLNYTTSSNGYEYLEMFVDGIRLSRTLDYAEVSTSTVRYLLNVPSGSVVTYKSLTLV